MWLWLHAVLGLTRARALSVQLIAVKQVPLLSGSSTATKVGSSGCICSFRLPTTPRSGGYCAGNRDPHVAPSVAPQHRPLPGHAQDGIPPPHCTHCNLEHVLWCPFIERVGACCSSWSTWPGAPSQPCSSDLGRLMRRWPEDTQRTFSEG